MEQRLLCGAASADITPDEELISGLYGLMGVHFAGVIDRLSLRVISLQCGDDKALIISFDLDKAPRPSEWLPELAAHTGIPEERILYIGTHTHSAPLTSVRPRERNIPSAEERECMNRYEETVKAKLFDCAARAAASMRPARMGCAYGQSFINVNRNANFIFTGTDGARSPFINEGMNWGAHVDRTLLAVRFEDDGGSPIAFFINYPLHCCLMFLNRFDDEGHMGISSDIGGNTSRLLEEKFPGTVAVWSSGAAGDVDPVLFNTLIYPDPADGHVVREPIMDWKMSEMQLRMLTGWHFKDVCDTIAKISCDADSAEIASAVTWSETPSYSEEPYRIRLQGLRVGEALLLGIGGELYGSFGEMLREQAPSKYTAVINHNASLIEDAGYILDDDAIFRAAQDAPTGHFIPGGNAGFRAGFIADSLSSRLDEISAQLGITQK